MKMNAKSVSEDWDMRRRDKDVQISSVQFLRKIGGIRGAKQGIIINDDNDEKEFDWFGQLGDKTLHINFEERVWFKFFSLIKEQYYHCSFINEINEINEKWKKDNI